MKLWFQDEDINSLITAHDEWLASNGTIGKQLMLENVRMCDIDFREVDFRKAINIILSHYKHGDDQY